VRGVFVSVAVEMPVLARDAAQDAAGQAVPQLQFKTQVLLPLPLPLLLPLPLPLPLLLLLLLPLPPLSIPILLLLIPMLQVLQQAERHFR
jgi:hypothetical protein